MADLFVSPALQTLFAGQDPFAVVRTLEGEIFREMPGRRTLRFAHAGKRYFLKYHGGVGWAEILKNVIALKRPVLGAENEMRAIRALQGIGIPTMTLVAYGRQGLDPARQESFVITEALEGCESLEDICKRWKGELPPREVWQPLVELVAGTAGVLHANGLVHKDLYICHFLVPAPDVSVQLPAFLIDLHRVERVTSPIGRWCVKDVAALLYSLIEVGIYGPEVVDVFKATYLQRNSASHTAGFWHAVQRKTNNFCARGLRKGLLDRTYSRIDWR